MVNSMKITDGLIESVTLYRSYYWLSRWDVIPFIIVYALLFIALFSNIDNFRIFGFISIPVALFLHLLLFLLSQWSISLQCKLGNYIVKDVNNAELVHVTTSVNGGNDRIVPLIRHNKSNTSIKKNKDNEILSVTVADMNYKIPTEYFIFQKVMKYLTVQFIYCNYFVRYILLDLYYLLPLLYLPDKRYHKLTFTTIRKIYYSYITLRTF